MAEDEKMTGDGIGQHRGRNAASIGTQAKKPFAGLRGKGQQLLPGIPNDITLTHIASKIPWSAFHTLSFVSSCWRQAIDRHEVYNARIRSQATETCVVLGHTHPDQLVHMRNVEVVHAVYSVRDKCCYPLPGIPHLQRGIPLDSRCVALDSRIYVVGGRREPGKHWNEGSAGVYVLDLAGQRKWKRCANMQEGRMRFGCGVMDGKIYAVGGTSCSIPVHGSEVYDPEANAWSSIAPMITLRYCLDVSGIGEELYAYNVTFDPGKMEVYHPGRNEWREFGPYPSDHSVEGTFFLVGGKFHRMRRSGVDVLEMDNNRATWRDLHSFSLKATFKNMGMIGPYRDIFDVVKAVNGELWAKVSFYRICGVHTGIFQSRGFGSENRELVWEKVNLHLAFEHCNTPVICPIQL